LSRGNAAPALAALGFANFVVGTGTFVVAGLLNEIAAGLGASVAAVGQVIAGYALALSIGAPLLAWLATRVDRRLLLALALAAYALLHGAAALAPDYAWLAAIRVVTGFAAAVVTPQSVACAGLLVPPQARGSAIAAVFLGFSLSSVVGVPLGTALGAQFGWRIALGAVGAGAALSAASLWLVLPRGLFVAPMDAAAWRALWRHPIIMLVVVSTILHAAGQFTLYTYLAPVLKASIDADAAMVGMLFAWFGVCGVAGNLVAGRWLDRAGASPVVLTTLSLMATALLLWPLAQGSVALSFALVGLWGLGCFATNASQQARLVSAAPTLASASVALNSSAIYLGQAIGGGVGGALVAATGMGGLSWCGCALIVLSIGTAWQAGRAEARHRGQTST
jgi:predicted MFS family arabinose efflux permease